MTETCPKSIQKPAKPYLVRTSRPDDSMNQQPTDSLAQAAALVRQSLDLPAAPDPASEQELLELMAARVAEMLEREPEQLMSLLYRLDVEERKIRPALQPGAAEPPHFALARLLLERQKQRIETKRTIRPAPLENMEGWEW
ncbi:MAG: hypothetical protein ACK4Q5_18165 [Saprospiraceae bacterium]